MQTQSELETEWREEFHLVPNAKEELFAWVLEFYEREGYWPYHRELRRSPFWEYNPLLKERALNDLLRERRLVAVDLKLDHDLTAIIFIAPEGAEECWRPFAHVSRILKRMWFYDDHDGWDDGEGTVTDRILGRKWRYGR
jgi:hypothetical protein